MIAVDLLALALGAAATASLGTRSGAERTVRLPLAFVLAALLLLPAPAALLVALAAAAAGRGGGIAGSRRRGAISLAALLLAVAAVDLVTGPVPPAAPGALVFLALAFAWIQTASAGLGWMLAHRLPLPDAPPAQRLRLVGLEAVNIPIAWLVAAAIAEGAWLRLAVLGLLLASCLVLLLRLDRALGELACGQRALSERLAELATLHSVSCEIPSSFEPERVFAILERECRRSFTLDAFTVALVDRESGELRPAYCRQRGDAAEGKGGPPVVRGAVRWVLEEQRARRIDDLRGLPHDSPLRGDLVGEDTRSLIAAPLVVETKAIGVLVLQCRHEAAYDDHKLRLLTTIAQQAAVAIENANHFRMATVDSLTGFLLRDGFFRRLRDEDDRARRYGGRFALLMLDLDGFKQINDAFGHLAGDRYLAEIATRIRAELRSADLACRYGGDEFCLLLPETGLAGAATIAERIREAVRQNAIGVDGTRLAGTVSVGIAAFPEHDCGSLRGLLGRADQALYRAKRSGRDRVAGVRSHIPTFEGSAPAMLECET